MPVLTSNGYSIAVPQIGENHYYARLLNNHILEKFGEFTGTNSERDLEVLKSSFKFMEAEFMSIIGQQREAAFYLFVHNFHENSCALWERKIHRQSLEMDGGVLATVRRVYKIILEQGCGQTLSNCANYAETIFRKRFEYIQPLEALLFLGGWAIQLSEYISKQKLYPQSVSVIRVNNEISTDILPHLYTAINHFESAVNEHEKDVVVSNSLPDLQALLNESYNLNYSQLCSFLANPLLLRQGVCRLDQFLSNLAENSGCTVEVIQTIFNGWTVSADNKMSFEDCIIRNQEVNRIICRPLLKINIEGEDYYIIGKHKWSESLVFLSYNCYPFGIYPKEWNALEPIVKFMNTKHAAHDLVLENPIVEILNEREIRNDHKVGSIKTGKGTAIPIRKMKGVGEIDIIFYHSLRNTIYICECKHNRSKFDVAGWYRDVMSFRGDYEDQLRGKVEWAKNNISAIQSHLELKYNTKLQFDAKTLVEGLFLINAPTLYIYDCVYPTLTIYSFKRFLDHNELFEKFLLQDDGVDYHTCYSQPFLTEINFRRGERVLNY